MIHLTLGRVQLDWGKNGGFQNHSALFRPGDLADIPYFYAADEDDPESADLPLIRRSDNFSYRLITEMKQGYSAPLRTVARRLLLLGYTDDYCRAEFKALIEIGYANHDFGFDDLKALMSAANVGAANFRPDVGGEHFDRFFAEHVLAGPEAKARLQSHTLDDGEISGLSAYTIIRLLANNPTAQELPVTWQFADVADGGWAPSESFEAAIRQPNRFLIVTEGTSDVQIIKHAIELLAPDLADFFDFVDMRENYPFSGTGNLYNFVRGLISIRIQNNVVVIFDNDAEGVFNWERSTRLNHLENMRIVKLPDRSAFEKFRTIGPTGEQRADINGKAAAIECYLDPGPEPMVRWTSYDQKRDCYQGVIEGKEEIARQFLGHKKPELGYDYSGLESILTMLIGECVRISEAEAKATLEAECPDD
ncbi:HEPN/Toprim-associated domain-containing protein [Bosea sp. LjRoot9]|uniref:HEPN/Toprim-associated domain-containing protein n=1 Tax=Bosea sp. LjRoot9 TaxID=3342341 RepID=UPI003ECFD60F